MEKDESILTVSSSVMARALGVTDRQIRNLADEGVLVKSGHGKYNLIESVANYIRNLKATKELKSNQPKEIDYEKEKAKHEKIKMEISEIELRKLKQEIHEAEDVERVMNDMIAYFKAKIMTIPTKLAPQLVNLGRAIDIQEILSEECRLALGELSEYDPSKFFEEVITEQDDEWSDD